MTFWIEPTPSDKEDKDKRPRYPNNNVTVTESGHSQEFDDTKGNERIRTQHRAGSFKEYQASGNVVHKIVGNGFHIVMKDQNVMIQGACSVVIYGNAELEVKGDLHGRVGGKADITIAGDTEITTKGDTTISSEGVVNVKASEINLAPTDAVYIDSDLNVRGTITGQQSICAFGNLTAGGHLGVQGSMMITGTVPQQGGPIMPHIITGLSLTSIMTGFTAITSGAATTMTSAAATSITSGAALSMSSGAAASLAAGGNVSITGAIINLN